MRGAAAVFLLVLLAGSGAPVRADDEAAADLLPLRAGNEWVYRANGVDGAILRVLDLPGLVNGEDTWIVSAGGAALGVEEHFTNDAQGLRLHRTVLDLGILNATVTFDPPLAILAERACVGDVLRTTGTLTLDPEGPGSIDMAYDGRSTLSNRELVVVPAGTFEAYRVDLAFEGSGSLQQSSFTFAGTQTSWFAPGVGEVRATAKTEVGGDFGSDSVEVLSELTAFTVPEARAAWAHLAALGVLASLRAVGLQRRRTGTGRAVSTGPRGLSQGRAGRPGHARARIPSS